MHHGLLVLDSISGMLLASGGLNPNRLDVGKLTNAVRPKFAAMTGLFYATKGKSGIGSHHPIDEHHSGFDFVDEAFAFTFVIGPSARSQPKSAVVGDADGVIHVLRPKDASYGTE